MEDVPEARATRVAQLYVAQRQLAQQLDRLRAAYHQTLLEAVDACAVSPSEIGHKIMVALGKPGTAEDLARAEWVVRKALRIARARHETSGPKSKLDGNMNTREPGDVKLLKRVTEYYVDDDYEIGRQIGDGLDDHDLDDLDEIVEDERRADSSAREDH